MFVRKDNYIFNKKNILSCFKKDRIILKKIMSNTSNEIIKLRLEHIIKNVYTFFAIEIVINS